jgi:hypothetical protein
MFPTRIDQNVSVENFRGRSRSLSVEKIFAHFFYTMTLRTTARPERAFVFKRKSTSRLLSTGEA